jgi:hypothetical protein
MMHGHEKSDPEIVAIRTRRCQPLRSWWSEGQGPREIRASKARSGRRTGQACPRRWTARGKPRGTTRRNGRDTSLVSEGIPDGPNLVSEGISD